MEKGNSNSVEITQNMKNDPHVIRITRCQRLIINIGIMIIAQTCVFSLRQILADVYTASGNKSCCCCSLLLSSSALYTHTHKQQRCAVWPRVLISSEFRPQSRERTGRRRKAAAAAAVSLYILLLLFRLCCMLHTFYSQRSSPSSPSRPLYT